MDRKIEKKHSKKKSEHNPKKAFAAEFKKEKTFGKKEHETGPASEGNRIQHGENSDDYAKDEHGSDIVAAKDKKSNKKRKSNNQMPTMTLANKDKLDKDKEKVGPVSEQMRRQFGES